MPSERLRTIFRLELRIFNWPSVSSRLLECVFVANCLWFISLSVSAIAFGRVEVSCASELLVDAGLTSDDADGVSSEFAGRLTICQLSTSLDVVATQPPTAPKSSNDETSELSIAVPSSLSGVSELLPVCVELLVDSLGPAAENALTFEAEAGNTSVVCSR